MIAFIFVIIPVLLIPNSFSTLSKSPILLTIFTDYGDYICLIGDDLVDIICDFSFFDVA